MIPVAALLLPALFWDQGPDSASQLREAKIGYISVPVSLANLWKGIPGISVDVLDPVHLTKVLTPSVVFHIEEASASRSEWVNSNGWRFLRDPNSHFYYEAPGPAAPLAAAESFTFGAQAAIHTDSAGLPGFGRMLTFFRQITSNDLIPSVNIGFVDDGSDGSAEFMNLLVRRNLLFRIVKRPDSRLNLTVGLGLPGYPVSEAGNPGLLAEKARSNLTDNKRLLRVYGSGLVVGRLFSDGRRAKLFLINYGSAEGAVPGLRVRVLGAYSRVSILQFDSAETNLRDVSSNSSATEFTLPELKTFAVATLSP